MGKDYQSLHEERIFIGGAKDVKQMIEDEQVEVVIDLRAEAQEAVSSPESVELIHIPLVDQQEGQEGQIGKAADEVIRHYRDGKKVALHCAAGRSRTGSVAIAVLLQLGIEPTVQQAEEALKQIRTEANVHPELLKSVARLFPDLK
ncbi:dual specificity protein phosphatase family protein [Paenibacillus sp. V4I5]|uniref:protein-tyrosine phosphatase family protein n=1 Tax=Paenibacillus sp. V4I5 TaxID=3042306 RepID=UPI00278D7094|nr:dual specificity protein phosphatase family protein [Paenibacillus sp. V4I5]MDQ0920279.1 protein-tyrosine phosphatase [Paenibacillus sp. V4I5]